MEAIFRSAVIPRRPVRAFYIRRQRLSCVPPISPSSSPMTHERPPMRGAIAGSLLIGATLLCAAVGFGVGELVGAPAALAIVGVFADFGVGIRLVVTRFRDL
jgi:hypothetical protein